VSRSDLAILGNSRQPSNNSRNGSLCALFQEIGAPGDGNDMCSRTIVTQS
jgi:hypothetical protein